MGRTTTSKYAVSMTVPGYRFTPASWDYRRSGKPTEANLKRYVESFEASTRPGECNAHLGQVRVLSACVRVNEYAGAVVASYEMPILVNQRTGKLAS